MNTLTAKIELLFQSKQSLKSNERQRVMYRTCQNNKK